MNIEALLASMTPEIYERLRQAVETGKWPDGTPLNEEQKAKVKQMMQKDECEYNLKESLLTNFI